MAKDRFGKPLHAALRQAKAPPLHRPLGSIEHRDKAGTLQNSGKEIWGSGRPWQH